jgi:hypothetical protein
LDELGSVTSRILSHLHVFHYYRTDDFDSSLKFQLSAARTIIVKGSYIEFFGFLQAILKHGDCPANVSRDIGQAFLHGRAAYFILNGGTIVPKSSSEEVITLQKALSDLHDAELGGARTHMRNAAEQLTTGRYADSVRESIHSVESIARLLEPQAELSKALATLEDKAQLHGALKKAFLGLYGYTSDEQGIRHALIDGPSPNVDEADALFMIGACAAFISYLIAKGRAAGLIK